ncbi:subtilisin [Trichoderma arundinaceum]|uniref:Subtilisin n=1 Tax=Trichoderma arundinaceum TaxID=490622 RepID=A0A395NF19_TRIAR|nr:subtilisin [Trichoderma arundinaceum]
MVHLHSLVAIATTLFAYTHAVPVLPINRDVTRHPQANGLQAQDLHSHIEWVSSITKRTVNKCQFKGVEKTFVGEPGFHGYAGSFDEETLAEIFSNPDVYVVEEDNLTTQFNTSWGLAAISHRKRVRPTDYIYDSNAGEDTFAYVVDTGIKLTHDEFEGRASIGFTVCPGDTNDSAGHGTHVSGIIAGKTFGVAKKASLVGVKVFQVSSTSSSIILSGFTWAVNDITTKNRTAKSVINMSLTRPYTVSLNQAVDSASGSGVLSVVVAAYSNWSEAVDVLAPGSNITSGWNGDNSDEYSISGTPMATPHVVGLALYAISVDGITGVEAVIKHLISSATPNKVAGELSGSPNLVWKQW